MGDLPTRDEASGKQQPTQSFAVEVAMFELSRIKPRQHVIDKIATSVIKSARLGAELLDGHAIRLPKTDEVWSGAVWDALLDKYLDGGLPDGAEYAVYLLRSDIVDARTDE